jgi:hypothetical protein
VQCQVADIIEDARPAVASGPDQCGGHGGLLAAAGEVFTGATVIYWSAQLCLGQQGRDELATYSATSRTSVPVPFQPGARGPRWRH